jgi:hypothetical protein
MRIEICRKDTGVVDSGDPQAPSKGRSSFNYGRTIVALATELIFAAGIPIHSRWIRSSAVTVCFNSRPSILVLAGAVTIYGYGLQRGEAPGTFTDRA